MMSRLLLLLIVCYTCSITVDCHRRRWGQRSATCCHSAAGNSSFPTGGTAAVAVAAAHFVYFCLLPLTHCCRIYQPIGAEEEELVVPTTSRATEVIVTARYCVRPASSARQLYSAIALQENDLDREREREEREERQAYLSTYLPTYLFYF